jgi:DNA polymerase III delta subunit
MLQKGKSEQIISKTLNIWHQKNAFFQQIRKASLSQIGAMISRLAQADYEIKTGRTNPRNAAEQLVTALATS